MNVKAPQRIQNDFHGFLSQHLAMSIRSLSVAPQILHLADDNKIRSCFSIVFPFTELPEIEKHSVDGNTTLLAARW